MNGSVITLVTLEDAERADRARHADTRGQEGAWPDPLPLVRPLPPPEPYPVDALGPLLANSAAGIADIVQTPIEIAASSVLAVGSLAAQPHVDVMHPATGRRVPCSLYMMTIAESGERKSAADAEALAPVRAHEKQAIEEYKVAHARWRNQHEAWEASRTAVKKKAKGNWQELDRSLQELGEEPKAPSKPYCIVTEPTFEGMVRTLAEGQSSIGLFSAEGGGFLGGHGMKEENRLRALTGLSELWDGTPVKRTRAGDGAVHLPGRRVSMHLMVQPSVAPMLLADEMAMGQGFLSRLLVCAPPSLQGKRFQRSPQTWARPAIEAYAIHIGNMMATKARMLGDGELDPLPLMLTAQATSTWRDYADEMERGLAIDGLSSGIRGLRNKTPEMALRISGVLSAIEGRSEIDVETFQRGSVLASFYLSEAKRLYEASTSSPSIMRATKLLRWIVERKVQTISLRDIQVSGPGAMRQQDAVQEAVAVLASHHLCRTEVIETGGRPSKVLILSPYAADVLPT